MGDEAKPTVICGLGLGDEGKGSFVDAWVLRQRRPSLVIRYNGGPQAAHHVVLSDGRSHCFAQLGAGMLRPQTDTLLSPFMLIEPMALRNEAAHLEALGVPAPLRRTSISRRCVVVTPFHKLLGRLREILRGPTRHGSCGLGVGQAWLDSQNRSLPSLRVQDLQDPDTLASKLRFLQLVKVDQAEQVLDRVPHSLERQKAERLLGELRMRDWPQHLCESYAHFVRSGVRLISDEELEQRVQDQSVARIFEGAQGVLLDAEHGFFPFVTPSRTTVVHAEKLLGGRAATKIGILRAYATRHGPGPLVSEDVTLTDRLVETHNVTNPWQGPMRVGWFDAVATRYALQVVGTPIQLALTCLDRLVGLPSLRLCDRYLYEGPDAADLPAYFVFDKSGAIRDLRREAAPTLARQQRLSELLSLCRPIATELAPIPQLRRENGTLSAAAQAYKEAILAAVGLGNEALACVSVGPTEKDKLWTE